MSYKVIDGKCRGCRGCMKVCPAGAIKMIEGIAVINDDKCTDCGVCVLSCKFEAIYLKKIKKGEENGL